MSRDMKALRGTKRVCHACAARFYDLSRQPIVCPSCGVQHVPDTPPAAAEAGARSARFTDKTGWRGRSPKHVHPEPDVAPEEAASGEDAHEEALIPAPNEDVVLDEEQDEADIPGLLGHHEADPKES
jgi:uncharacterized protein (TIGR02300 family)